MSIANFTVKKAVTTSLLSFEVLFAFTGTSLSKRTRPYILQCTFPATLLKMPVYQIYRTARSEPMSAVDGGRLANDEAYYTHCLINVVCTEAMTLTFHVLGTPIADPRFAPNHILRIIIRLMASVHDSDWSVPCSAGKLIDVRAFFTVHVR